MNPRPPPLQVLRLRLQVQVLRLQVQVLQVLLRKRRRRRRKRLAGVSWNGYRATTHAPYAGLLSLSAPMRRRVRQWDGKRAAAWGRLEQVGTTCRQVYWMHWLDEDYRVQTS